MKTCKACGKEKNDQEFPFHVDLDSTGYFGDVCIQCEYAKREMQVNICELCGKEFDGESLLCYDCNIFLKYFNDDVLFEKAIIYIVKEIQKEQKEQK